MAEEYINMTGQTVDPTANTVYFITGTSDLTEQAMETPVSASFIAVAGTSVTGQATEVELSTLLVLLVALVFVMEKRTATLFF